MRAYLLMAAAVLVFAPAVHAQTPKPVNRGRKPKFAEAEPGERATDDAERSAPKDPLVETLERLSGWPGERARRAAEQLIVQKERSRDLVLRTLSSVDPKASKLKPGCAYVLGYIGEKSHALALILAASEPKQAVRAEDFFLAAYKLDPNRAIEESFRFFYDSRTTLRRQALKFVRDRVTRDHRDEILDLLDRRKAERGFTRVIGLTLWDRLIESEFLTWEEGGARVYRALGDDSPQVARHAMKLLASRNDETNLKALNALIQRKDGHWRERSYAALTIALLGRAFQTDPLQPESRKVLQGRGGILHARKLPQAAAALALAQAGLRSGDSELARLLDREIPIILINSVGADGRHYKDFSTVRPLAYSMLRRITGQTLPDQAPRWARWWGDYGRRFRARRELIEVADNDYAETSIDLLSPRDDGVGPIRLSTVSAQPPTYLRGQAFAIPREDMVALVKFLGDRKFFVTTEADVSTLPSSAAVVSVHVGDLDRTCAFAHVDGSTVARDEIVQRLRDAAKRYDWQRWWDIGAQSSWALFYSDNVRWFRDHTDEDERARRLRSMVAGSLTDLRSIDLRLAAVRLLAGLPGGGEALTENQAAAFVRAIQREREANAFVQEAVHLLLAAKTGPSNDAILASLAVGIDTATLIKLAADDRWKVRRAVVASLGERDEPAAKLVLLQRLQDKEMTVRVAAVEQLARKNDPTVLPKLRALARDSMGEVRASVAYAYGYLARDEITPELKLLLYEDPLASVRQRAIEGIRAGGAPSAVDLLLSVFETETDSAVRSDAAAALVELETPTLVTRLIKSLDVTRALDKRRVPLVNVLARMKSNEVIAPLQAVLLGDDPVSADTAALGLARRWNETSLSVLVTMVKRNRNPRAAVMHLQVLTSHEFDATEWSEQAGNYEAWMSLNVTGNPRIWFRDALRTAGYDGLGALDTWVASRRREIISEEMIPLLMSVLRDERWFLASNASMLLNEFMADEAPNRLTYLTGDKEGAEIIDAYHNWWADRQEQKREQERR